MATFTLLSRHRIGPTLLAAVAMVAAADGCGGPAASESPTAAQPAAAAPEVPVVDARLEQWPRTLRVQGNLLGNERSTVGSKIAGRVEQVFVDLGTIVRQGQPLVALDASELELHVRQAEAQLLQACAAIGLKPDDSEAKLDRQNAPPVLLERAMLDEARAGVRRAEQLRTRRAISDDEFDRLTTLEKAADARYQSSLNSVGEQIALIGVRRAELALARQQLAEAQVIAPYDGIVEQRHVASGDYVQVGDVVVTLVRADTLRFTAGVPERSASLVHKGQTLSLQIAGESSPRVVEVSRVSPSVNSSSRALWIEADVPNADFGLRTGLFAEADIVIDPESRVLTVPAEAVIEFAGIQKVWIVKDGEAVEQPIRTGRRDGRHVEVLDGLAAGEAIVAQAGEGQAGPVVAVRAPGLPKPLPTGTRRGDEPTFSE